MKIQTLLALFLICLILFTQSIFSQNRKYLYGGFEAEILKESEPLNLIFTDFNTFHDQSDIQTNQKPLMPMYVPGFMIGSKIHVRFSEFGGNVHFMRYATLAQGIDADGNNYDETLTFMHNGFCLHYSVNFINTNYLRTGPGFGIKLEQYRIKLTTDEESNFNTEFPTNKAIISGRLNYTISIGGPKFNLDIVAFYNLPLWSMNLEVLNQRYNQDYYTDYTTESLDFNPVAYGLAIYIGLGSKENYDF